MKLPLSYTEKMKNLLKEEYEEYIKSFDEPSYQGLRANTLKISPQELKEKLKINLEPIAWCETGFYYEKDVRPAKSPYYNAGLFYIQEPSAMSTGAMLPIEEGDRVLDICAAPGGKSTQVAAKLGKTGVLISNDISATRCKALLKNIEVFGLSNAIVINESPEKLAKKFKGYFNKIIVDAPCSGEGMFRKDKDTIKSWEEHKTEFCCSLQKEILKYAKEMLDFGGIIAYSTCTFAPEENEQIINDFLLENQEDFEILDFDKTTGFEKGRADWVKGENIISDIYKSGRLWPYKVKGEGHFLCLLRKKGVPIKPEVEKIKPVNKEKLKDLVEFFETFLNIPVFENIEIHGSSVFSIPDGINLDRLRVVRSGFYLGELKTKRFEPSQAFAMALKKEDAKLNITFKIDEPNLIRYLKGESIQAENKKDGWYLICLEEYPLGWGKVVKGRLKNKYLPGWKI